MSDINATRIAGTAKGKKYCTVLHYQPSPQTRLPTLRGVNIRTNTPKAIKPETWPTDRSTIPAVLLNESSVLYKTSNRKISWRSPSQLPSPIIRKRPPRNHRGAARPADSEDALNIGIRDAPLQIVTAMVYNFGSSRVSIKRKKTIRQRSVTIFVQASFSEHSMLFGSKIKSIRGRHPTGLTIFPC